jgi:hypothetical protein
MPSNIIFKPTQAHPDLCTSEPHTFEFLNNGTGERFMGYSAHDRYVFGAQRYIRGNQSRAAKREDPLSEFSNICRAELEAMQNQLR